MWDKWNLPIFLVKGWIIGPDVHGFLDGSCDVVDLPTYYGEVVHADVMTHDACIAKDR